MTYECYRDVCNKCGKMAYCITHHDFGVPLCQDCFCWALGYADEKDKVNLVFATIPDIEQREEPTNNLRDLD